MESISAAFGVQIKYVEIKAPKDIDPAFGAARKAAADAVVVLTSVVTNTNSKTDHRACGEEPATGNVLHRRMGSEWRAFELWRKLSRSIPARGDVCRQDSEGHKAR
jgi:hypothetical protein